MKNIIPVLLITLFWFSCFTGSSEVSCLGNHSGKAFGNFFLWNMTDPTTSLSMLIDLRFLLIDFLLSYLLTYIIYHVFKLIFKVQKNILKNKKMLVFLSILILLFGSFSCLNFMFGLNIESINCERILNTFSFGLRMNQ